MMITTRSISVIVCLFFFINGCAADTDNSTHSRDSESSAESGSDTSSGGDTASEEDTGSDADTASEDDSGTKEDTTSEEKTGSEDDSEQESDGGEDTDVGNEDSDSIPSDPPLCAEVRAATVTVMCATDTHVFTAGYTPWVDQETDLILGNGDAARTMTLDENSLSSGFISKTDADGTTLWSVVFERATADSPSLSIDDIYPSGDGLFVMGYTREGTRLIVDHKERIELEFNATGQTLFRFSEDGALDWVRRMNANLLGSAVVDGQDLLALFKVDENGAFETGDEPMELKNAAPIYVLVRYDTEGNIVFLRRFDTDGYLYFKPLTDGSVLVSGNLPDALTLETEGDPVTMVPIEEDKTGQFIARYDATGQLVFARPVFSAVNGQAIHVIDDQLFITGYQTDTVLVAGDEETLEFPFPEGALGARILVRYSLAGELLGTLQTSSSGYSCEIEAYDRTETTFDMILSCENPYTSESEVTLGQGESARTFTLPDAQVILLAARFDNDGELLIAKELLHFSTADLFYFDNPIHAAYTDATLTIRVDIETPIVFSDAPEKEPDAPNNFFDTRIAVFDDSFTRTAVHRSRTVQDMLVSDSDAVYLFAENDWGFFRFDDRFSVDNTAFVVRFQSGGALDWISGAGVHLNGITETQNGLWVVTEDDIGPMTLGNGNTGVTLETILGARRTYLARFDKETGTLTSYGRLVSTNIGECSLDGLTQCTDEVLDIEAVAAYRDPAPPDMLRELAWQETASIVDPDCLEACGPDDGCTIRGTCTTNGVEIGLTVSDSVSQSSEERDFRVSRSVHVRCEDDGAPWTEAAYEDTFGESDILDGPSDRYHNAEISWTGRLLGLLPDNSTLTTTNVQNLSPGDIVDGASNYSLVAGSCDISWAYTFEMNTTATEHIEINSHTYELVHSDEDWNTLYLYIDDACAAEVDVETWEELGACEE